MKCREIIWNKYCRTRPTWHYNGSSRNNSRLIINVKITQNHYISIFVQSLYPSLHISVFLLADLADWPLHENFGCQNFGNWHLKLQDCFIIYCRPTQYRGSAVTAWFRLTFFKCFFKQLFCHMTYFYIKF